MIVVYFIVWAILKICLTFQDRLKKKYQTRSIYFKIYFPFYIFATSEKKHLTISLPSFLQNPERAIKQLFKVAQLKNVILFESPVIQLHVVLTCIPILQYINQFILIYLSQRLDTGRPWSLYVNNTCFEQAPSTFSVALYSQEMVLLFKTYTGTCIVIYTHIIN